MPTIIGYGLEGALKFGSYESLKPAMAGALAWCGLSSELSTSLGPIAAAVIAGGLASVVLAPAEATRIRMVSDPQYEGLGLLGAASQLYVTDGPAGLLRGVLSGSIRLQERLHTAGLAASPICNFCRLVEESVHHCF